MVGVIVSTLHTRVCTNGRNVQPGTELYSQWGHWPVYSVHDCPWSWPQVSHAIHFIFNCERAQSIRILLCVYCSRLSMKSKKISNDQEHMDRVKQIWYFACASSEGSGEPAHPRSLARTFAARSYKQWVKWNLQTESQIPGPSEWLGMRS